MDMPSSEARFSTYGQSNESPLYVTSTCGFTSRTSSKKRRSVAASVGSL